jgi:hypothetical protein
MQRAVGHMEPGMAEDLTPVAGESLVGPTPDGARAERVDGHQALATPADENIDSQRRAAETKVNPGGAAAAPAR